MHFSPNDKRVRKTARRINRRSIYKLQSNNIASLSLVLSIRYEFLQFVSAMQKSIFTKRIFKLIIDCSTNVQ